MPVFPDPAKLRDIPLFHDLETPHLERINALIQYNTYPRGRAFVQAEQPGEFVYIVYRGVVQVRIENGGNQDVVEEPPVTGVVEAGRSAVILALLGPGEVIGEMSVVDSLGRSATVLTHEESVLLWMNRTAFWDCLRNMPALTFALTQVLTRRLRIANTRIQVLSNLNVGARMAYQLLSLAHEYGEPLPGGGIRLPFRLTHEEIAELVGATRVRVSQVLPEWRRLRYIAYDPSRHITIRNEEALRRFCL